jgi:hypothetical protein
METRWWLAAEPGWNRSGYSIGTKPTFQATPSVGLVPSSFFSSTGWSICYAYGYQASRSATSPRSWDVHWLFAVSQGSHNKRLHFEDRAVIRPQLSTIRASPSFQEARILHVQRSFNVKADHNARLALYIKDGSLVTRCLSIDVGHCPGRVLNALDTMMPFRLLSVKCST